MGKKSKEVVEVKVEKRDSTVSQERTSVPKMDQIEVDQEDKRPKYSIKEEDGSSSSKRNKLARLIVRNLPFKVTEAKLRKHFSPYGELTDVQILRRQDGRLVGCGFVEFAEKLSAAKAIAHLSGQPLLNRPIVVDWAVPKNRFDQMNNKNLSEDSEESGFHEDSGDDKSRIKTEVISGDSDEDSMNDSCIPDNDNIGSDNDSSEDERHNNIDSENEEEESDEDKPDIKKENGLKRRKPLRESHDIAEGCTVFVKNLPFTVDNQEFKKCMQRFGPIYYALVCYDPISEHSKGTGFVKFKSKDVAEACLAAGRDGNIMLRDSVLETHPAKSREDLEKGASKKADTKKDGRNLYLVKEGVILAGSPAAVGVSPGDMAKRLQLEQWKTQVLKNLNKFVSRNRLVIQNLPPNYDNLKLRSLFLKYGGKKPVITEARVMRDLRNVDADGVGKSKEYGFVCFTSHENALHALRALNNNPNIFSPAKRPIVAFSIENRAALNLKQRRLERSRANAKQGKLNASNQKMEEEDQQSNNQINTEKPVKGKHKSVLSKNLPSKVSDEPQKNKNAKLSWKEKRELRKKAILEKKNDQPGRQDMGDLKGATFMGEKAKEGQTKIMSRKKLHEQAEIHSKLQKAKNRKERLKKHLQAGKIKQPKQKLGTAKFIQKEDNFSKLVDKYRNQLASSENERKKWYEQ